MCRYPFKAVFIGLTAALLWSGRVPARAEREVVAQIMREQAARKLAGFLREDVNFKNFVRALIEDQMKADRQSGSAVFWMRVSGKLNGEEFLEGIAEYYAANFSQGELDHLVAFFETPGVRSIYYEVEDMPDTLSQAERDKKLGRIAERDMITWVRIQMFLQGELGQKLFVAIKEAEPKRRELGRKCLARAISHAQASDP